MTIKIFFAKKLNIVVVLTTKKELLCDKIKNILSQRLLTIARRHLCQFMVLRFQQMDGLNTVMPFGTRKIDILRTLTTESLAVFIPFRVQEIRHENGIYYGQNVISKNMIIADRKQLLNGNSFVLGVSGSGKSFIAKEEITSIILKDPNADVIIVDPEREASFLFTLWKRVRKYGAYCTGITQNVEDMLQSHTARTMLANSELIIMLNQASTDRAELAKLLNISELQMSYITNVNAGEGLIKIGSSLIPFFNRFPKNTELYKLMTTKPRRRCIMKKILYIFSIILLISLILISSYHIYKESKQNKQQENVFENLIEVTEQINTREDNKEEIKINVEQLYTTNNDIVGWLKIKDTKINYPIMQSINNPNYYLRRDFYKNYSSYGTPYISEQCNVNTSDNIVIYGHHINNKKMFGELENYKTSKFYENHKIIEFTTLNREEKYEIFAVFKTVAYSQDGFKYYEFINFNNKGNFDGFISKCKQLSFYETNIKPKYGDKLITLSTCEYSNKNGRLVVIARRINE